MNTNSTGTKAYIYNDSTTAAPSLQSVYNPPRYHGEVGWICPVCGRGNAPSTAYCNCNMTKPDIVYANGGLTTKTALDNAIPCNSDYTTTATTATNKCHDGVVYGAH